MFAGENQFLFVPVVTVNNIHLTSTQQNILSVQALSRRIHYGKYVAEVKFRDAPQDYMTAICAKVSVAFH